MEMPGKGARRHTQSTIGGAVPAKLVRSCVLDWLGNQNKTANHYVIVVAM
jgi:hypothetical protein